jgi:hypothetical protein
MAMVWKILLLPFWLLRKFAGIIVGIVRICYGIASGIIGFIFGRTLRTIFGGLIGAIAGSRHIKVKVFRKK